MLSLTPRQRDALRFIQRHIRDVGRAPAYRAIAAELGVAHSRAYAMVQALKDKLYACAGNSRFIPIAGLPEPHAPARPAFSPSHGERG